MSVEEFFLGNAEKIRLGFFISGLIIFFSIGHLRSFRKTEYPKDSIRWINNLLLIFFNAALIKFLIPVAPLIYAAILEEQGFGLLYRIELPLWANVLMSVILLDLVIYFQHLLFHRIPILWRLHRLHHADTSYDTTTALRFHPIEIFLSLGIKVVSVYLLGVSPLGLIVFKILLNFSAMFNHGNFTLPKSIETPLVRLIVTPDMHRIHHSVRKGETNSNYGFFLSIWDHLFKTYVKDSTDDPKTMEIGLHEYRKRRDSWLHQMLIQPFK